MEIIKSDDIDQSVYNIEAVMSLISLDKATPYAIAKKVGKETQQTSFRDSCGDLCSRGILISEEQEDKNAIDYSLNYTALSRIFFEKFKDQFQRVPTPDDYKLFERFFSSKTVAFYSEAILKNSKISKGNFDGFLKFLFLFLSSMRMSKLMADFQQKYLKIKITPINKNKVAKINIGQLESVGIFPDEHEELLPKMAECCLSLFKSDTYFDGIKNLLGNQESQN